MSDTEMGMIQHFSTVEQPPRGNSHNDGYIVLVSFNLPVTVTVYNLNLVFINLQRCISCH
ncbi:hypothetical protein FZN20_07565 [Escherichia coli]|nr:hypothetical protein [Escherichia coli]